MEYLYLFSNVLAQVPNRGMSRVLGWSLAIVAVVVVGLWIISRVKRSMQQTEEPVSTGFTLSDLRQLYKSGQMSNEEFEKAKAKIVEAAKRAAEREEARKSGTEPIRGTGRPDGPASEA